MTTVFVCGPELHSSALTGLTVRDGAVVWEDMAEPAPQPVEPIIARYRVPVGDGLIILVTEAGLYVTTADGSADGLPPPPLWGTLY